MSDRVAKVKSLLGLSKDTPKEEMSDRHRKIIEEVEPK